MDHPYYAVTDATGSFAMENVPAGTYQVKIWHETLGETVQEVTIEAGASANLSATLSQS